MFGRNILVHPFVKLDFCRHANEWLPHDLLKVSFWIDWENMDTKTVLMAVFQVNLGYPVAPSVLGLQSSLSWTSFWDTLKLFILSLYHQKQEIDNYLVLNTTFTTSVAVAHACPNMSHPHPLCLFSKVLPLQSLGISYHDFLLQLLLCLCSESCHFRTLKWKSLFLLA